MDSSASTLENKSRQPGLVTIPLGCAGRFAAFLLALVVFLSAGLSALVGMLLLISGQNFTIGPENLPFWPRWLAPRDLLHTYAWLYLLAAVMLPLFVLPLILAILEKAIVAVEKRKSKKNDNE
jgi:hypothetical protein